MGVAVQGRALSLGVHLHRVAADVPGGDALHPQQQSSGGGEVDAVAPPLFYEMGHEILPRLHGGDVQIVDRPLRQRRRRLGGGGQGGVKRLGHGGACIAVLPGDVVQQRR